MINGRHFWISSGEAVCESVIWINDLLKNKQDEVEVEEHSIHQLLDEALELASDRIRLKNIVVTKKYEQDCKLTLNGRK
jgi:hypothetical protein